MLNWFGFRFLAWLGVAAFLILLAVASWRGAWLNAGILACFLAASAVYLIFKKGHPSSFDLVFVAAMLLSAGGWAWNLYGRIWLYDEVAHAVTTGAFALAIGYPLYRALFPAFRDHPWRLVWAVLSTGLAVGALWEAVEWLFAAEPMTLGDTVMDLVVDSIGALFAAFLGLVALRREPRTW